MLQAAHTAPYILLTTCLTDTDPTVPASASTAPATPPPVVAGHSESTTPNPVSSRCDAAAVGARRIQSFKTSTFPADGSPYAPLQDLDRHIDVDLKTQMKNFLDFNVFHGFHVLIDIHSRPIFACRNFLGSTMAILFSSGSPERRWQHLSIGVSPYQQHICNCIFITEWFSSMKFAPLGRVHLYSEPDLSLRW
jgi:hypothetical protein